MGVRFTFTLHPFLISDFLILTFHLFHYFSGVGIQKYPTSFLRFCGDLAIDQLVFAVLIHKVCDHAIFRDGEKTYA